MNVCSFVSCADHEFVDPATPTPKHILGQAAYQLAVMTWLLLAAPAALGLPAHVPGGAPSEHFTLLFNAFVWMQLFNQLNARKILDASDVGEGLASARLFQAVVAAEALLQAGIVQCGGAAFATVPLSAAEWALCLGLGAGSLGVREALRRA